MCGHIGDRQGFATNRRTRAWRGTALGHTLVVDGISGPKTQAWVRGFQRAMASEIPASASMASSARRPGALS
jgi:hypothetical protein